MSEVHIAASKNDVNALEALLKDSPATTLHAVDYEGRTPLHVAASNGCMEAAQLLLSLGADPTRKTTHSFLTPADVCPERFDALKDILSSGNGVGHRPIRQGVRLRTRHGGVPPASPTIVDRRSESPSFKQHPSPLSSSSGDSKNSRKGDDKEEELLETNKVESTEIVNPRAMRKVIIAMLLPIVTLMFVNGLFFALKFLAVTACFYFLVVGYFVSEITIRPPWYHHHPTSTSLTAKGCPEYWEGHVTDPMHDFQIPFEHITIPSTEGYRLSGWYVPPPNNHPTPRNVCLVLVHGGGRDRRAWLRHLPMLHSHGYAAVLFDFREHGLSSGNCNGFTYGMKERYDVVAAAKYAKEVRGHRKVVAIGTSVGGSSVIMAAALDATTIDGVVAENAITTCAMLQDYIIMNLFGGYISRHWVSVQVFNAFRTTCSNWLNIRIGNKPTKHCQALHCVHKIAPRPLLLMHGTNDDVVPMSHSEALYNAAKEPKRLWLCDGAFHCGLYNREPSMFEEEVLALLAKVE